jgi:hypothetical protein
LAGCAGLEPGELTPSLAKEFGEARAFPGGGRGARRRLERQLLAYLQGLGVVPGGAGERSGGAAGGLIAFEVAYYAQARDRNRHAA